MRALAYYDGYRSARLPANLLQAQRDYFGAHTFERIDQPRGKFFHLDWPNPEAPPAGRVIPPGFPEPLTPPRQAREAKRRARPGLARHGDPPAVELHEEPRDREPEPGARLARRAVRSARGRRA